MPQTKPMPTQSAGFTHSAAVTPSDTVRLPGPCRGLYVGVTGDVGVQLPGNAAPVVIPGVPAGAVLPIAPTFVRATGTTATGLLRMW